MAKNDGGMRLDNLPLRRIYVGALIGPINTLIALCSFTNCSSIALGLVKDEVVTGGDRLRS